MRNRQRVQALPLKQICAPNLKGASVYHSSRRSLCFAFLFSFFFFRKPSCARMRLPGNVSSLKPHEMRPEAPKRDHGTTRRQRPTGRSPRWNPKTKCSNVFKTGLECGIFFAHLSCQCDIAFVAAQHNPGRFLEEIRALSSPPKEHHIRGPF